MCTTALLGDLQHHDFFGATRARQHRKIALPWLSLAAVNCMKPTFHRRATELSDDFIEIGEADIVVQLTTPLAPPEDWQPSL